MDGICPFKMFNSSLERAAFPFHFLSIFLSLSLGASKTPKKEYPPSPTVTPSAVASVHDTDLQ